MGQITENDRNSHSDENANSLEEKQNSSVSLLSDADYEFLFNQLLEGVAHGWHDRRIIKFFDRLGDRGKAEDWVAWLERLRSKVVNLPVQSKRQLGSIMIRLGELTQSAAEVREIGSASNRIGRELLFGNQEDVIWEYVGPDLVVEDPEVSLETEAEFSERLPEDFAELGKDSFTEDATVIQSPEAIESVNGFSTEDRLEKPRADSSQVESISQSNDLEPVARLSEDLEFELDNSKAEAVTDDSLQTNLEPEKPTTLESVESNSNSRERLLDIVDSAESLSMAIDEKPEDANSAELPETDPTAIDIEQVMNLIQEDDSLAREISQKLNLSPTNNEDSLKESSEGLALVEPVDLDRSSIDLIEGWFNLGLKQVSGGEFDKAIASWEKALNINPNLSEAWHNRGSALGRLGKYQEAVESFQKALQIDPQNYQAWNDRAHALYQLKNWAAAADSWSNAIKITPANHLFWYNRGCALEQLESWAESISSYEKSLEIKPDFQPARSRYTNLISDNSRSN